jgi:hypothetical protein
LAEVHMALADRLTPENIPGKCFLGESFQIIEQ